MKYKAIVVSDLHLGTKVDPKNHYIIYQKANSIFNHPIKLNKHHPPKKPWYKFWQ